jgi:predicted TPR repeat methyltransferase
MDSRDDLIRGAYADAAAGLREAATRTGLDLLRSDPSDPAAGRLVGHLFLEAGQPLPALAMLERALAATPDDPALIALAGRASVMAGDLAGAEAHLSALRAAAPGEAATALLEAELAEASEGAAAATELLRLAAERHPGHPEVQFRLALALAEADPDAGRAARRRAIELDGRYTQRPLSLIDQLVAMGRVPRALDVARRALALDPGDEELRHLAAALGGEAPERAADGYVAQSFDRLAGDFERRLRDELDYRVPEHMAALLADLRDVVGSGRDVIDLGCGTGLCAPVLRPYAAHLAGVDLSPGMLEQARATGLYDRLVTGEITSQLESSPAAYDLIAAGDVLIYFGDLGPVFAAAAGALRPGGLFVFSVEKGDDGHELQTTGRWRHGPRALAAAAVHGLRELERRDVATRLEHGSPVPGYLVAMQAT